MLTKIRKWYRYFKPGKVDYGEYIDWLKEKGRDTTNVYPGDTVKIKIKDEIHYAKLVIREKDTNHG